MFLTKCFLRIWIWYAIQYDNNYKKSHFYHPGHREEKMELRHGGVKRIAQVNIGAGYTNHDCNKDN